MTDADEIPHLHELLAQYRRNLTLLLRQFASYGANDAPLHILNGITETQAEIARLKKVLRELGENVADQTNDIAAIASTNARHTQWRPEDRAAMLANVRRIWIDGVLKQSLWNDALLTLQLTERPDAVVYPYGLHLRATYGDAPFPVGTTIQSIYDAQQGALLILGQPGSGKTTLLLELTRTLLDRATSDPTHPIPVVCNLATWQEKQTLAAWLVVQLNREYAVAKRIAQAWVAAGMIVPLLDGLDEVAETRRAACVEAINTYRREYEDAWTTPIVVCCRVREYEALPPLQLHGAIQVQPLTHAEIDTYLRNGGRLLAGVRAVVKDDSTLYELLETPLLLAVTTLAFAGHAATELRRTSDATARRRRIFASFVVRQLEPPPEGKGVDPRYGRTYTLRYLEWLGRQMQKRDQSIYWIESMQRDWLATFWSGWTPSLISGVCLGVGGVLFFGVLHGFVIGLIVGPVIGVSYGFLGGLLFRQGTIDPVDSVRLNWQDIATRTYWIKAVGEWLIGSLFYGLLIGLGGGAFFKLGGGIWGGVRGGLLYGLLIGLGGGVCYGILKGFQKASIDHRTQPNESIHRSVKSALGGSVIGMLIGLIGSIISIELLGGFSGSLPTNLGNMGARLLDNSVSGFVIEVVSFIVIVFLSGLLGAMEYGGVAIFKHYVLRLLLKLSGDFPWNITAFLDSCAQRRLLQRVGGGWRFPHNLIRDYLAELEDEMDE